MFRHVLLNPLPCFCQKWNFVITAINQRLKPTRSLKADRVIGSYSFLTLKVISIFSRILKFMCLHAFASFSYFTYFVSPVLWFCKFSLGFGKNLYFYRTSRILLCIIMCVRLFRGYRTQNGSEHACIRNGRRWAPARRARKSVYRRPKEKALKGFESKRSGLFRLTPSKKPRKFNAPFTCWTFSRFVWSAGNLKNPKPLDQTPAAQNVQKRLSSIKAFADEKKAHKKQGCYRGRLLLRRWFIKPLANLFQPSHANCHEFSYFFTLFLVILFAWCLYFCWLGRCKRFLIPKSPLYTDTIIIARNLTMPIYFLIKLNIDLIPLLFLSNESALSSSIDPGPKERLVLATRLLTWIPDLYPIHEHIKQSLTKFTRQNELNLHAE